MPSILARASLAALLTVTALPVAAKAESYRLESRLALESQPRLEVVQPRPLKSPGLAVGLSVAAPLALSSLGTGLIALGGSSTDLNPLNILGVAVSAASPLALGAGQAYAGDPQRGLWVGLGTYGALIGSTLLGFGVAYAAFPQAMSTGGQSAGMAYALTALPLTAIMMGGYSIWALVDAHQTATRHNEAAYIQSSPEQ